MLWCKACLTGIPVLQTVVFLMVSRLSWYPHLWLVLTVVFLMVAMQCRWPNQLPYFTFGDDISKKKKSFSWLYIVYFLWSFAAFCVKIVQDKREAESDHAKQLLGDICLEWKWGSVEFLHVDLRCLLGNIIWNYIIMYKAE